MNTFKNRREDTMRQTPHKLLSTAAAVCLVLGTTTSVLAQNEFAGSLNTVSISDAAGTNKPPTASFTYTQDGDTFTFDAGGSFDSDGTIIEYLWVLGDGTTGTSTLINHQFAVGSFPVTLKVKDNGGAVALSQILIENVTAPFSVIVDNLDTGFSRVGSWTSSTSVSGFYATDYYFAAKGDGSLNAIWAIEIPVSTYYTISAQWPSHSNRGSNVPYEVINNGLIISSGTIDQRVNGGVFNILGNYPLNAGSLKVVIKNKTDGGVIADAIKVDNAL